MTVNRLTYKLILAVAMLSALATNVIAQTSHTIIGDTLRIAASNDTLGIDKLEPLMPDRHLVDSTYREITFTTIGEKPDSINPDTNVKKVRSRKMQFRKPDPETATWLALAIPGGGQIYNRKFWKLPIVYGGFVGCLYAYNWNGQMYKDYRQAYLDIMDSDPNTNSYKDFFHYGYDYEANKEYLKDVFKKRKDRYRRWRDLSIFSFIGVYVLSVIDAYVDAQLSNFDISEDINLSIEPQIINSRQMYGRDFYGFNCNIRF